MLRIDSLATKTEYTKDNVLAFQMIESLKKLQYSRRFSKNEITVLKLQLNRDLYIEMFVGLARRAKYNDRRIMRLAHEVNKRFVTPMMPQDVHTYTLELLDKDIKISNYVDIVEMLEVTDEELDMMLGMNRTEKEELLA